MSEGATDTTEDIAVFSGKFVNNSNMGGGEAFRGAFFRGEKNCILVKFDRIGIQVIEEIVG